MAYLGQSVLIGTEENCKFSEGGNKYVLRPGIINHLNDDGTVNVLVFAEKAWTSGGVTESNENPPPVDYWIPNPNLP